MRRRNRFCLTLAASLIVLLAVAGRTLAASPVEQEYKAFGREVAEVVSKMKEVAVGDREKSDLRALEFLLRDYNQAVDARNWKQADLVKERMRVSLTRGSAVAAEAEKRKADKARADAERRHRELMRKRELPCVPFVIGI